MESPWRGFAETDHSVALRLGEEMDPLYQHLHLYEQTGGETFILRALKASDPPIHFSVRDLVRGRDKLLGPKRTEIDGENWNERDNNTAMQSPSANGVPVGL